MSDLNGHVCKLNNYHTRATIRGYNPNYELQCMVRYCMVDGPWMLHMNLPVDDAFHPQSNRFVEGVKITATGDSKHNDWTSWIHCKKSK